MSNQSTPQPTPAPETTTDLVLLHGWGMNSAIWNGVPEHTWNGLTQYRLDLPGHGDTPVATECNTLWGWAETCLDIAPERAVWVGWSLGGLIALAAALHAPKRVAGLILLTATPRFTQATDWAPAMPEATLAQFHDGLRADPRTTLNRFLALQTRGSNGARETLRLLKQALAARPEPKPAALALGLDLLREEDLRPQLPDIRCPTLWLFGQYDTLVPARVAERIKLLMPEAQVEIIPGAAHAPHLSHANETSQVICAFLNAL
ncbi:MAG: pimeloyl-ACP methyl ester esterase BioH [Thermochromatium sp.]